MLQEYNPEKIEKKWQDFWDKKKIFAFDKKSKKPVFSIDVPPVYASAAHLHIGHALHYTQFEIIARLKRMQGFNVYFSPCFDDNGLPTEKYVEEKFNLDKSKISKQDFRKLCLKEAKKVEDEYSKRVYKKLGHSYDWSLLYTTISPEAQVIAQRSFIELYDKKECYRAEEPVIWCTKHQTSLAQAELEDIERTTTLNYVDFDLANSKEKITIATTRPEFLSACVGIFVHPDDSRYKKIIGKEVIVPVFKQKVKIMKDEKVDKEFGTGIVMVCTFGDTTDIEWWKKHKLELKNIITKDGRLQNSGILNGLKIDQAKEKIIEELKKENRIKKQETLKQTVGVCWRCSTPVEFIVTKQWFIKTLDHKKELIDQGKKINWYPDFYRIRYEEWVKNLQWDWCISRQRFYGFPIPIWYCKKCGNIIVADKKQLPVDPEKTKPLKKCSCGSNEFIPEEDIFDTWMTSSMSPQIATKKYDNFETMSMRPQAHDIIRTWAFYTILKSYLHFNKIPWKDIALGTFVLDPKGHGMHKSKGNAIWFEDLYNKYKSVDVIRYWVGTATFGEDIPFQEKDLITGKKFLIKLWNASKFAIMNIGESKPKKPKKLEKVDELFLNELNRTVFTTTYRFENYDISRAKFNAEEFFWKFFCDNYLEIIKKRIYNGKGNEKLSAQYTLYESLLTILKLFAPIVPHITEDIYQTYYKKFEKDKSIHVSRWPEYDKKKIEDWSEKDMKSFANKWFLLTDIISKVRQEKTKAQKSMKAEINLSLEEEKFNLIKDMIEDLKAVCNAKTINKGKFKIEFL